jgi:hypothetical protein
MAADLCSLFLCMLFKFLSLSIKVYGKYTENKCSYDT